METKCEALVRFSDGFVKVMLTLNPAERAVLTLLADRVDFGQGDTIEISLRKITKEGD